MASGGYRNSLPYRVCVSVLVIFENHHHFHHQTHQGRGDIMGWLIVALSVAIAVFAMLWQAEVKSHRKTKAKLAALQAVVETVREGLG
jgi:hypothetical protein